MYAESFIKSLVNKCYDIDGNDDDGEDKTHPIDIVTKSIIPHYLSLFKSSDLEEFGLGLTLLIEIAEAQSQFGSIMIEAGLVDMAVDHIFHQPFKHTSINQSYEDYSVGHCGILFRTLCKGGNWDVYDVDGEN